MGDRIAVLVLFILSVLHIAFYPLFVFYALLFIKQSQVPELSHFTFTDKEVIYEVLFLIPAFQGAVSLFGLLDTQVYLTVAIWSIIALWYVDAGYCKLKMYWWEDHLEKFVLNAKVSGLLGRLDGILAYIYKFIRVFRQPMIWFVLCMELGAGLLFVHKGVAIFLLLALIGMHSFIFVSSGIFFWKWKFFNGLLLLGILLFPAPEGLFSLESTLLLLGIIASSYLLPLSKVELGWYDIGGFGYHAFSLIRKDGSAIELDPSFFSPYDLPFVQSRFLFLQDRKTLFNNDGSNRVREINQAFSVSLDKEAVLALVEQYGENHYDEQRKRVFDQFLVQFIQHKLAAVRTPWWSSPMHIYFNRVQKRFIPKGAFEKVRVRHQELYFPDFDQRIILSTHDYFLDLTRST